MTPFNLSPAEAVGSTRPRRSAPSRSPGRSRRSISAAADVNKVQAAVQVKWFVLIGGSVGDVIDMTVAVSLGFLRNYSKLMVVKDGWLIPLVFFFSSRRRHTRLTCDWSSDVCSSD